MSGARNLATALKVAREPRTAPDAARGARWETRERRVVARTVEARTEGRERR